MQTVKDMSHTPVGNDDLIPVKTDDGVPVIWPDLSITTARLVDMLSTWKNSKN